MSAEDPNNFDEPTYDQLASGELGHVEVIQITYDTSKISFENLCRYFFTIHDPTTFAQQGDDVGQQYSSTIFCHNEMQQHKAEKIKKELREIIDKENKFQNNVITTEILAFRQFYFAKQDHQKYLEKNPGTTCSHFERFQW